MNFSSIAITLEKHSKSPKEIPLLKKLIPFKEKENPQISQVSLKRNNFIKTQVKPLLKYL